MSKAVLCRRKKMTVLIHTLNAFSGVWVDSAIERSLSVTSLYGGSWRKTGRPAR